jgi:hypothetical protein
LNARPFLFAFAETGPAAFDAARSVITLDDGLTDETYRLLNSLVYGEIASVIVQVPVKGSHNNRAVVWSKTRLTVSECSFVAPQLAS